MGTVKYKRKLSLIILCLFIFNTGSGFTLISDNIIVKEDLAYPMKSIESRSMETREYPTPWVQVEDGTWVRAVYVIYFKNPNYILNQYDIQIGCYYEFQGRAYLYSDRLYINGAYVGTWSYNNGWHNAGTIYREITFSTTLKCGKTNILEFQNVEGVGGAGKTTVSLGNIGKAPQVISTNGTWYEGEVNSGIRTWQSLYTDGATGSIEGNKIQTSTGFMYVDRDEQTSPVNAYSNTVLGRNSYISKIVNQYGKTVDFNALNNVGTYTVHTYTTDSGGLRGEGTRVITVRKNTEPTIKSEDRWFYASETVTTSMLLERVSAVDPEDGNITNKVYIASSNVVSGVVGNYKVTYKVADSFGVSVQSTANIYIISDDMDDSDETMYLRFIDNQYINTLKDNSIWHKPDLYSMLSTSLAKETGEEISQIYLSPEDIKSIQVYNDTHDYSKESNALFYEQFQYLWK